MDPLSLGPTQVLLSLGTLEPVSGQRLLIHRHTCGSHRRFCRLLDTILNYPSVTLSIVFLQATTDFARPTRPTSILNKKTSRQSSITIMTMPLLTLTSYLLHPLALMSLPLCPCPI